MKYSTATGKKTASVNQNSEIMIRFDALVVCTYVHEFQFLISISIKQSIVAEIFVFGVVWFGMNGLPHI